MANLPVTIRYGVPAALVAVLVWWAVQSLIPRYAEVRVLGANGEPVGAGVLEVFALREAGGDPSPGERLGEVAFEDGARIRLGEDLVQDQALVRVRVPGLGIDYGYVESEGDPVAIRLGPPRTIRGRVLGPDGKGAAGARVLALGGGRRGVVLLETATDSAGDFELKGISSLVNHLVLRVFFEACAVLDHDWDTASPTGGLELRLRRTRPVAGRVVAPAGLRLRGLVVRVYHLPGVETRVLEDGRFLLDHLPPRPLRGRLLVAGLPNGYTHRKTLAAAGDTDLAIEILPASRVRGRVVYGTGGEPAPYAAVVHEHGPSGEHVAYADENGVFTIDRVPPGRVLLRAEKVDRWRRADGMVTSHIAQGVRLVEVARGEDREGVEIRID